jgi:nitrate reductase alpha subunit
MNACNRMTSTTLLSDVVLPAATWYEKHDVSTTDMHPFIHAFTPAIDPPWEAKSDFDAFHLIARRLSDLARTHLGVRQDLVSVPLHDVTPAAGGPVHSVGRGPAVSRREVGLEVWTDWARGRRLRSMLGGDEP